MPANEKLNIQLPSAPQAEVKLVGVKKKKFYKDISNIFKKISANQALIRPSSWLSNSLDNAACTITKARLKP